MNTKSGIQGSGICCEEIGSYYDVIATITGPSGYTSTEVYYGTWTREAVEASERRFMMPGDTLTLEVVPA